MLALPPLLQLGHPRPCDCNTLDGSSFRRGAVAGDPSSALRILCQRSAKTFLFSCVQSIVCFPQSTPQGPTSHVPGLHTFPITAFERGRPAVLWPVFFNRAVGVCVDLSSLPYLLRVRSCHTP